jgi:hypothetical protein
MSPFESYRTFLAVKNHFTTDSYDYIKYNGKIGASQSSFETRKDKYQFYKLSKHKDPLKYLVANFVDGDLKWVGDLFNDESEKVYAEWLKRQQSLTYIFEQDLNKLLTDFDDNVIVKNGQHPYLLKQYLRRQVSIETIVILNDILGFFGHWNKKIEDSVLWPSIYKKLSKYKPFFHYDAFKCRKILKDKFAGD